jgi:trans-aconitate methyltransferase
MADKETLSVYDAKAAEYDARFSGKGGPDAQLRAFLDRVPAKARLWDLGCGPGRSAGLMAAEGHEVLATDASAEMVVIARTRPGVQARREVFDEIAGEALYDGIFANFSLLHAAPDDIPRHLAAIATALRPGGVFHMGMKLGEGMHRDSIGRRYTYVTEAELETLFREAGLEPVERWFGEGAGLSGSNDPWIVMHGIKHA